MDIIAAQVEAVIVSYFILNVMAFSKRRGKEGGEGKEEEGEKGGEEKELEEKEKGKGKEGEEGRNGVGEENVTLGKSNEN